MEDSISTILYLVITFIVLVVSVIKKRKKNIPKTVGSDSFEPIQEEDTEPKAPKKGIESFLNTLLEEQSPFVQENSSSPQNVDESFEKDEFIEEWEEKKEEIEPDTNEGITVFAQDDPNTAKVETGLLNSMATKDMEMNSSIDKESEVPELRSLIEDFEVKKAIIYSEILNPKYF